MRKLDCTSLVSLEVKPPVWRGQWEKPTHMLHFGIKRLDRIADAYRLTAGTRQFIAVLH